MIKRDLKCSMLFLQEKQYMYFLKLGNLTLKILLLTIHYQKLTLSLQKNLVSFGQTVH